MSDPPDPRAETFGYVCGRCASCCRGKLIQINPYETARLTRRLEMDTAAFREAFTKDGGGTHLAQTEDGACVFLGPEGCAVHSDRPLVCRLYPLGRSIYEDGAEAFFRVEPLPTSTGVYHDRGTVADYLEAQGAAPFMAAADGYFFWLARARQALQAGVVSTGVEPLDPAALFDLDRAVEAYCAARGAPAPEDLDARLRLHLEILFAAIGEASGPVD